MDPLDDFEFKPLTPGLGFHKKTIELSEEMKKSRVTNEIANGRSIPSAPPLPDFRGVSQVAAKKEQAAAESVNRLISSIPAFDNPMEQSRKTMDELIKAQPIVSQPLPREGQTAPGFKSPRFRDYDKNPIADRREPIIPIKPAMEDILGPDVAFEDAIKPNFDPTTKNRISEAPLTPALREVPFLVGAFVFDFFVAVGLTSLFTGVVLAVTQADLGLVIENASTDLPTRVSIGILLLAVIQMYMVLSRSFFGCTLGEWAFDMELGNSQQQKSTWYPVAVAWRATIVAATGFVLLPLISLLFKNDLAGKISGLKLYKTS